MRNVHQVFVLQNGQRCCFGISKCKKGPQAKEYGILEDDDWLTVCPKMSFHTGSYLRMTILLDVSDIFYFFPLGGGEGSPGRQGGGGSVSVLKSPGGGGVSQKRRGGPGRVSAGNLWGGGAKYFFSGPKCPPSKSQLSTSFANHSIYTYRTTLFE